MRLYNVFYVCKLYYPAISGVTSEPIKDQQNNVIKKWDSCKDALYALRNIPCLEKYAINAYNAFSSIERDQNPPSVSRERANRFMGHIKELRVAMETLLSLCDALEMGDAGSGIDIKIPKCESLKEYMGYLKDIDFILTQCPFLLHEKEQVKFKNVDVGSQWLAFAVLGSTGAFYILNSLAKLIGKVVEIKSNLTVYKMQEEMLVQLKQKNEVMDETIDVFKKLKEIVMNDAIQSLEEDIHPLKDGEERDKVKRSIEMLHSLMEKGVEIYSSIETPKEVKVLFPFEKDTAILPESILKLIEEKATE